MALESASTVHPQRLWQHQLCIEDSENRSHRNNIRLQGIPEATSGTNLRPTGLSILNKVLGREAKSPIELDRVHRVGGGSWGLRWLPSRCSLSGSLLHSEGRMNAYGMALESRTLTEPQSSCTQTFLVIHYTCSKWSNPCFI